MVVYAEYAFLENFVLDALLLYLALKCARGRVRFVNLLTAAAVGAGEALVFPLLPLPVWAAYPVKFLGGALIAVIAVSKGTKKTYAVVTGAFFLMTFALGGILTAVYSFFGVTYAEGGGYLVESAPVGLVLGCAGVFAVAVTAGARAMYRYRKMRRSLIGCVLTQGGRTVHWQGYADSGNLLTFRGEPVCVVSAAAVFALFGAYPREVGRIALGTVSGGRESPVFCCERMETEGRVAENVYLTVGELNSGQFQILLHTAYLEEERDETVERLKDMARTGKDGRKRRTLSLRKRGAAAPALGGGRERDVASARSGRGHGDGEGEAHRA